MLSRKIIVLIAALFAVCLSGQIVCRAQGKESNLLYAEPKRLMLPGDEDAERETETATLLREKFYPIGWSKDGKFAYYAEPPDEACDCYFGELLVRDLRTDKTLWSRDYNSDGKKIDTLEGYWKANRKEFSRKLRQYGIEAGKPFELKQPPIIYRNDALTFELNENIKIEDIFAVGSVVLKLISKEKGAKTIYEENYQSKDYSSFRSAEIAGVFVSPFEARAAVVIVETHRGWEGPPNITRINVVGASLTAGFR